MDGCKRTDSECATICPLTTASMAQAKDLLGADGDQVELLGIDANPAAKVADVLAYSRAHGLVNQWDFLTGSPAQLRAVWNAYGIYVQIQSGQVDHTPALYVIDQQGREQKVYLTTMAYASVGQEAQVLAQEAASLLPGHPRLASQQSLAYIGGLAPTTRVVLPVVPAGSVTVGRGRPHLLVFFATWLTETSDAPGRNSQTDCRSSSRSTRRPPSHPPARRRPTCSSWAGRWAPPLPSIPPVGSPTGTGYRTSRGTCSPQPRARSCGSTPAGSRSRPRWPQPAGPDPPDDTRSTSSGSGFSGAAASRERRCTYDA